ncbi:MAG: UvrD-helicase domain-containing protein [Clostridia bacterium]|nr:UvrD-helicase domain-containing protein [Clostridia bacterium]
MELLEQLNAEQLKAVTSTEGYVRVIAGAGSGKTRALTHRFAYLVNELGILPGNILCVTFTNKAANEMRQRIHALTGDNDTAYVCTFHSFCVSVLQEDGHAVQYPKSFLVLDNADIDEMLKIIYEERGLTLRDMTFGDARDMIEMKKLVEQPHYYFDMLRFSPDVLYEKYQNATKPSDIIFYGYLYQEKKCFGLDYNDLIKVSLYIFAEFPEIRQKWQERLEYIMIDEFQDIDRPQYELMEVLCGYHRNLFIVGDPDQTIYTWRGADVNYLLQFDKRFVPTKTVMMNRNYRSTPEILAAVNDLIAKNTQRLPKDLTPILPSGDKVRFTHAKTAQEEAAGIVTEMLRLKEQGVNCRDMTVLYRAHYLTRTLEDALRKAKLPYRIYSGVQFYNRQEIKDALAYLRMVVYQDDLSFRRIANVPKRNLGERRMAFLRAYATEHICSLYTALKDNLEDPLFGGTKARQFVSLIDRFSAEYAGRQISEVLSDLLDKSGYEAMLRTEGSQERLDNLAELRQSVYEYETTCGEESQAEHYLSHVALFTNADTADTGDAVRLMTVHAAKGLEFPYVFLCGMNEGIFPSKKTNTLQGMEEERRLAFVAMTRAQKRLYLSDAEGRNLDGSQRYPSRFIFDIDETLLDYTAPLEEGLIHEARAYIAAAERNLPEKLQASILPEGQRVRHSVFGEGTVTGVDAKKGAHMVLFDGIPTPRAISFKAKLEVLEESIYRSGNAECEVNKLERK